MNIPTLAWRNVGRNRRRSALSVVAIAVATLSVVVLFSLLEGMKSDLEHNLTTFYTGDVEIRHRDYGTYEHLNPLHLSVPEAEATREAVAAVEGVHHAVNRITVPGAVMQDDERIGLQAMGVEFERETRFSEIQEYVVAGSLNAVTNPDGGDDSRVTPVLVGNRVLQRLGLDMGERFTVVVRTATRGTNAMTFRAMAVADFPVQSLNETTFWAPLDRIQRLAQMPGETGEILVGLSDQVTGNSELRAQVMRDLRASVPELEVRHFSEIETTYGFMQTAANIYNVIAIFFFLLASTVIINTTMMVIFERRREIGTLEAMGMRSGELIRMFFFEALILGFLGALAGLAGGTGLALLLGEVGIDMGASMDSVDFEISPVLHPVVNLRSTLLVFVGSIVVSAATSYLPTLRITRIEPVAALREE
ncbi:MAG: FtsX-like permease family protein [Alkalispirochaeta sp.]